MLAQRLFSRKHVSHVAQNDRIAAEGDGGRLQMPAVVAESVSRSKEKMRNMKLSLLSADSDWSF